MDLEIIKEYLQNYVDSVLTPKINTDESLIEPITIENRITLCAFVGK